MPLRQQIFLSAPSVRRAASAHYVDSIGFKISIHTLREESDRCGNAGRGLGFVVSTHVLREEGDSIVIAGGDAGAISIRALREEGDR